MFILYTTKDVNPGAPEAHWYKADRIVSCSRSRPPMSERVRNIVRGYNDGSVQTITKNYIPWSRYVHCSTAPIIPRPSNRLSLHRINKQLLLIMTTMGTSDGKGMTREQSIAYLKWVLLELGIAKDDSIWNDEYLDYIVQVGPRKVLDDPSSNRQSYDNWVSWAVDAICDYPMNLFQGISGGDGGGTLLDEPNQDESEHLRVRIWKTAFLFKLLIPGKEATIPRRSFHHANFQIGLKIARSESDPENGWAYTLDVLWNKGPPTQSGHMLLTDPWFMPIYQRGVRLNASKNEPAAPDDILSEGELGIFLPLLQGYVFKNFDGWGFNQGIYT